MKTYYWLKIKKFAIGNRDPVLKYRQLRILYYYYMLKIKKSQQFLQKRSKYEKRRCTILQ